MKIILNLLKNLQYLILDIYVNQYILKNAEKIKINVQIQNKLSIIIKFLKTNNSSNAYRFNKWLLSIK